MGYAFKTYHRENQKEMRGAFVDERLDCKSKKCLEKLDVNSRKIYKDKPSKCPKCKGKQICKLQIYGAKEGALFWECEDCDNKYLMFPIEETLTYLIEASKTWYNPNDFKEFAITRG